EDEFEVLDVPDGPHALEVLRSTQVDVVLLDIRLPGMDGLEVLEQAKSIDEQVEVILVTAVKTVKTAVTAMKLGAFDYLTKPFEEEEVLAVVRRALERRALQREVVFLRSELARRQDGDEIVGQSAEMRKLAQMIAQVSRTSATVLIAGESGTGKELIAQAIHRQSPRRDKPFVPVNPAAIVESLIESELFGHERGAFTGAYQRKLGKFEMAQGGTLFLDEIASLRAEPQTKLLRVLQEREIERVGGTRRIPVDVRIIAATNVDLKRAVAAGGFREDLYYRLNVVPIAVPPLRSRSQDVPLLVEHFIRRYNQRFGKRITGVAPSAMAALEDYRWPGNVRELQNVVERAVALVDAPQIQLQDLPMDVVMGERRLRDGEAPAVPLAQAVEDFERQIVQRVLERVRWSQQDAAMILGLHRNTLLRKIAKWGLVPPPRR
ncbi:MAG: sigma-54 dependent transcriptional regulator, partial [Candidatus Rokuibacteriota bacterium]